MKRGSYLAFVYAIFLGLGTLKAQPRLGLSNANGMPSVISQGGFYSLSGWIVNTGNQPYSGTIDMRMNLNGSFNALLTNNFSIASLPVGDSVFWQKPSYNFPPGQLRLGNNDIIVWPTAPSGGAIMEDSLYHVAYNCDGQAAFRLSDEGVEYMLPGVLVDQFYTFDIGAVNVGLAPNTSSVKLIAEIPGLGQQSLDASTTAIQVGETVIFNVSGFKVSDLFDLTDLARAEALPDMQFFVMVEQIAIDPINRITFPLVRPTAVTQAIEETVTLYPNPSSNLIKVSVAGGAAFQDITIYDAAMRQVLRTAEPTVDVGHLASGLYTARVTTELGTHMQQFVRQ